MRGAGLIEQDLLQDKIKGRLADAYIHKRGWENFFRAPGALIPQRFKTLLI